jgi:hypothetical protein
MPIGFDHFVELEDRVELVPLVEKDGVEQSCQAGPIGLDQGARSVNSNAVVTSVKGKVQIISSFSHFHWPLKRCLTPIEQISFSSGLKQIHTGEETTAAASLPSQGTCTPWSRWDCLLTSKSLNYSRIPDSGIGWTAGSVHSHLSSSFHTDEQGDELWAVFLAEICDISLF